MPPGHAGVRVGDGVRVPDGVGLGVEGFGHLPQQLLENWKRTMNRCIEVQL